jgi:hypothetical protein
MQKHWTDVDNPPSMFLATRVLQPRLSTSSAGPPVLIVDPKQIFAKVEGRPWVYTELGCNPLLVV